MPVPVVAGQPRGFQRENCAHFSIAHGGEQPTEARTLLGAGTGDSQILIDDNHGAESECPGALPEGILPPVALNVVLHLLECGLADVDVGGPVAVCLGDLVIHGVLVFGVRLWL